LVGREQYVPEQGDIVWLKSVSYVVGRKKAGRRMALVVSPRAYNERVGLALFCPIISSVKGYPFEVGLGSKGKAKRVILSDQVKSLDWRARKVQKFDRVSEETMLEVVAKIGTLVG